MNRRNNKTKDKSQWNWKQEISIRIIENSIKNLFEEISKIDKPLTRLTKNRESGNKLLISEMKAGISL